MIRLIICSLIPMINRFFYEFFYDLIYLKLKNLNLFMEVNFKNLILIVIILFKFVTNQNDFDNVYSIDFTLVIYR